MELEKNTLVIGLATYDDLVMSKVRADMLEEQNESLLEQIINLKNTLIGMCVDMYNLTHNTLDEVTELGSYQCAINTTKLIQLMAAGIPADYIKHYISVLYKKCNSADEAKHE